MAESGTVTGPESSLADTTSVEFGAAMRDMRKAHNRELSDVANALRIRQVYLQAIEDGRFDDLPGPTYAAGFVRAYADYLGLELDEVMRRYRSATGNIPSQAALVPPSPMSEARLPTGFILLVAAILSAAAYGGWYYLTIHGQSPTEVVSALPKRISDAVGLGDKTATNSVLPEVKKASTPTSAAEPSAESSVQTAPAKPAEMAPELAAEASKVVRVSQPTKPTQTTTPDATKVIETAEIKKPVVAVQPDPVAVPVVSDAPNNVVAVVKEMPTAEGSQVEPVVSVPVVTPAVTAEVPKTVIVQAPPAKIIAPVSEKVDVIPAPKPAASQIAAGPPQQNMQSRIVLRATVTSWVELRDAGGKRLLSRLLRTGETYKIPGRSGILFTTGNAGGIEILVDGQPIAALGPIGAVRRDIAMDPKTLLARKPGQR